MRLDTLHVLAQVWSYAPATRCPVLASHRPYHATHVLRDVQYQHGSSYAHICSATSGTEQDHAVSSYSNVQY
eukprot:3940563-Rhodomonas_salina.6